MWSGVWTVDLNEIGAKPYAVLWTDVVITLASTIFKKCLTFVPLGNILIFIEVKEIA